jgi:hypothetical protein
LSNVGKVDVCAHKENKMWGFDCALNRTGLGIIQIIDALDILIGKLIGKRKFKQTLVFTLSPPPNEIMVNMTTVRDYTDSFSAGSQLQFKHHVTL